MQKVLIIGCCGAGKSTAAVKLGKQTGLPVFHLDQHFWKPNWQETSKHEFDHNLETILKKPKWIIDGNFQRTLAHRAQYADTIIFLNYSRWVCVLGILKRWLHGKRVDELDHCKEKISWKFFKYVWNFQRDEVPKIWKDLQGRNEHLFVVKNRKELEQLFKQLI